MLEQWKQDIETTHNNQKSAYEIKPESAKEMKKIQRYIRNCELEMAQTVRLIGREVAGRYIRTNREAYELGAEWLNQQGMSYE